MIRRAIVTCFVGLSITQHAMSESGHSDVFRIVREVVIEKGSIPNPKTIVRMNDGSFVIAGRMEQDEAAWATQVDAHGNVRWRFLLKSPSPEVRWLYPEFSGAVGTPRGGALLCGTIDLGKPRKPGINGLLVRVDSEGKLEEERFITPPETENEYSHIAYLDTCIAWKDGAALIGRVTRHWPGGGQRDEYHWIVAVNADGAIKWQKLIPSKGGGVPAQVRRMPDDSLIIADTETIRVDAQGELQARSPVTGLLRLVQPVDPHADAQLFDCYGGKTRGRLLQLTGDLQISKELALMASDGYMCGPQQYTAQVFGLTDESIVLFGYRYDDGLYTPDAVKLNIPLKTAVARRFTSPRTPWFNAATPSGKLNEFATVRVTGLPTVPDHERAIYLSFIDTAFDTASSRNVGDEAPTAPLVSASTHSAGPQASASQIDQLLAIHVGPLIPPPGISGGMDVNVCVESSLRRIDPANHAWNPSDPRWAQMRAAIAQDCAVRADRFNRNGAPVMEKAYLDALRQGYRKYLDSAEAETLIRFYESDAGSKYRALQAQLATVSKQGMGEFFSGKASSTTQAPAPDVMETRMKLLRLSPVFSALIVANEDKRRAGKDASGATAIVIMMSGVAASQGDTLDRIGRDYSADLHDFAAFAESSAETDELRAFHEATVAATASAGKFIAEFSPELNGDLKRWRDLYNSLPSDRAAPPVR